MTRPSTESEFNEVIGKEERPEATVIYEGPCQVRATARSGRRDEQAGEREIRISSSSAKFPSDTPVQIDDRLEVTSSSTDAGLVGRTFRVTDVLWDGWQVSRAAILEEVHPS